MFGLIGRIQRGAVGSGVAAVLTKSGEVFFAAKTITSNGRLVRHTAAYVSTAIRRARRSLALVPLHFAAPLSPHVKREN